MMPPRGFWADHGWFIVFAVSVISIITLVVFGRLVAFEFINHDDPYFVTLNKYVTGGLSLENIRWAFTSRELGIWHPLTWMSYQLETTMFGTDSPGVGVLTRLLEIEPSNEAARKIIEEFGNY